jgi:hypothetical protein
MEKKMSESRREKALERLWPTVGRDELGLCRATTYDLAAKGQIPTVRLGKKLFVPASWLKQYRNGTAA